MKKSSPWKSGVNTFVFSAIADGNLDLVAAYKNLSVEEKSGLKALSPVFVETAVSKAKIDVEEVAALIKRTQNVSICFLLDTTGSMGPYVTGIKDQIVQIVTEVQASNCVIAGLAFVGYKDWCDGDNHFEVFPFTTKIADFKNFVGRVNARGGGDVPEDVIGGLNQALKLQWPETSGSRILYHMGDAPPHGKERYHCHADDFPKGHPEDRTLSHLFLEMRAKRVSYYFGRINSECDQMLQVFETHYGIRIEPMDSTKVSTLANRVTASVMKTVTSSCLSTLSSIKTSGCVIRKYHLDLKEPDWSRLPTVGATITTYKLPTSVSDVTSFSEMEEVERKCSVQIAPNPFAKGSVRLAYYGRVFHSIIENERSSKDSSSVVFKELITLPKVVDLDRQRYMAALEIQTVASKFATEFNDRLKLSSKDPDIKVQFHVAKVVQFETEDEVIPRYMAYESRFRGSSPIMVKYTNSLDFVLNPGSTDEAARTRMEVVVAFSHFTHSFTDGYLLVCDLQGITTKDKMGKPTLLLTDPAIHCPKHNLRFGRTNLGALGVNRFFAKHKCNSLCLALGLKMPPKYD